RRRVRQQARRRHAVRAGGLVIVTAQGTTMDFFGHQDRARRASGRLVLLFAAAVLGLIACVFLIAKVTLVATEAQGGPSDVALFAAVGGITIAIVGVAMLVKTAQLRGGGGTVATMLGGTEVPLDPADPKERLL